MAAYGSSFESSSSIEERKESKRKAREQLLSKAKDEHEKAERRKEQRRLRGEDTWMLDDVNERLEEINQHSGKKKKKDKHQKKTKKEKKKKSKKDKDEKNASSADSSQDSEDDWVEANPSQTDHTEKAWKIKKEAAPSESVPAVEREEWMTLDFMSLRATSTAALRAEKQKEKTLEREKAEAVEKVKLQARELNPFWKDGGLGLPPAEGDTTSLKKAVHVEDGGLSWLRKSYQRMKEQAEREKRNLEDVVAARYGSMESFQSKLDAAEKTAMENSATQHDDRRDRWRRYPEKESRRFVRPDDDRPHTTFQGDGKPTYREPREPSTDKPRWERRESDCGRTESEYRRHPDRSSGVGADPKRNEFCVPSSKLKNKFLKPSEDGDRSFDSSNKTQARKSPVLASAPSTSSFIKPASDDNEQSWRRTLSKGNSKEKHQSEMEDGPVRKNRDLEEKIGKEICPRVQLSTDEKPPPPSTDTKPPPVQMLSEEEMNKLGAKIVKAEILGNMELAAKLRTQLEDARQQSKNQSQLQTSCPATAKKSNTEESDMKEDDDVLLIKTDQSGRSWPVNATADSVEPKGGRRKRQMVTTHVDKERVRYFHDDDNQSLQDLVKREKMGTAEDQNKLYMRMASKLMEKTDRDYYTLDDMFVSKAAKKERVNEEEERERQQAIAEHRRLAARMEKCPYCLDNTELPKHLIIAIGVKVYLCLPNHLSLTEGHCLIVPCQHYTASTLLDEDIWNEIQMFRKALVKMFEARDLDCVFLESNINMKKRLHLVYECIPVPKEVGDMAPIYFKKAIQESDEEWSMNKKLIDLSSKDIRRSVPKGLPYFSVDFGLQGGFAHVIENEHIFPHYFGKEIIGGMLDLEPRVWRKGIRENFDDQRKKVLQFSQWWKPFNFNKTSE
ncbi:CWF19-like protein 2 [Pelodytes ibericus]